MDSFTKRQIEIIFADEKSNLNHIFCTNTLLKGVNLNANNLFFLAEKGKFDNSELDKKNLLGRVGRLNSNLQGKIFRFYIDNKSLKFETIKKELNASTEPCIFKESNFSLNDKMIKNKTFKTYLCDKNVTNRITNQYQDKIENINCFDYFIGVEQSKKVQDKFNKMSSEKINEILQCLKLSEYKSYVKIVSLLNEIYDWSLSEDNDLSKRMTKIEFVARLFYNVAIGTTIKKLVKNSLDIAYKNNELPYVVTYKNKMAIWFLTPDELYKYKYKLDIRNYQDSDKNILIYTTMSDVNNLIEYKLKVYLQDLYYRLKKITKEQSPELEAFLTHSIVNNTRKIELKNIGIVDDFAITELSEKTNLFDSNNKPNLEAIKNYAKSLGNDNPLKYSLEDVFGN